MTSITSPSLRVASSIALKVRPRSRSSLYAGMMNEIDTGTQSFTNALRTRPMMSFTAWTNTNAPVATSTRIVMFIAGVCGLGGALWGLSRRTVRQIDVLLPDLDPVVPSTAAKG